MGASQAKKDAKARAKLLKKLNKDDPTARMTAFAKSYEESNFLAYYKEFDAFIPQSQKGKATMEQMTDWGPQKKYSGDPEQDWYEASNSDLTDMVDQSIRGYCESAFKTMNRAIRTDHKDKLEVEMPKIHQSMEWLDAHKDNFWPKVGNQVVTWRGTKNPKSVFENLEVGKIYRMATFVSTSLDKEVAETWPGMQCIIKVIIKQKNTRSALVKEVASLEAEEEILIAPYQPVKVLDWDDFNMLTVELLPEALAPQKAPLSVAKGYDSDGGGRMGGSGTYEEGGGSGKGSSPSAERLAKLRRQQKSLLREQERLKREVDEAEDNVAALRRLMRQSSGSEPASAPAAPASSVPPPGRPFGYPPMAPHPMMMTPYGHAMMPYGYPPAMGHPYGYPPQPQLAGPGADQDTPASIRAEMERQKEENRMLRRMLGRHK